MLTAEQGQALRDQIADAIPVAGWLADDLADLDAWLGVLLRARAGLAEHCDDADANACACGETFDPCPDARRYTESAESASAALTRLAAQYGVPAPLACFCGEPDDRERVHRSNACTPWSQPADPAPQVTP